MVPAAAFQLPPMPQPLVIFPHMMALYPQTLVVKERVLDNFDINLMDGRALMRVDAKLLSFHGRKSLFDPNGSHLFDIIKKPFHIHTTFAIEDQSGRALMEVRNNLTRKRPPSVLVSEESVKKKKKRH